MPSLRTVFVLAAIAAAAVLVASAGAAAPLGPSQPTERQVERVAYLTFDDGPDRRWTPRVLDLLRRYDAHATFFALGASVAAEPALARRIVREGHTIGNHTYDHVDLARLGAVEFNRQVDRAQATIRRATGTTTRLLRPPFGHVGTETRRLAAARGHRLTMWDVDPQDWRRPGADRIAATVLAGARPGAIVLLHDGGGDRAQTVAALERVLVTLKARGYRFAALT